MSTFFLSQQGYKGDVFKAEIKKVKKVTITESYSEDRIKAIASATTHGSLFQATGGLTICGDDFFRGAQKSIDDREIEMLLKMKKTAMKDSEASKKVKSILVQTKCADTYNMAELRTLLQYYGVKKYSPMNKSDLVKTWKEIMVSGKEAPSAGEWTKENEERLNELTNHEVPEISDTHYARQLKTEISKVNSVVNKMTPEERQQLKRKLDDLDGDVDGNTSSSSQNLPELPPPIIDDQWSVYKTTEEEIDNNIDK